MIFLVNLKNWANKHTKLLLWLVIGLYALIFSLLSLKKLDNFLYNGYDLAIFNQVFFNSLQGNWFELTANINNYLADHFAPLLILLLPFYALKIGPANLLILQSIIIALSAWPLYKIGQLILKNNLFALGISLAWLFNPFVHNTNFYEFHLLPFAAFFILWTFYFYQKKNLRFFLLFFILSLLVREDIALIMIMFSVLAWLDKRTLSWKLTPLILAGVYFIFSLEIISYFSQTNSYKFLIYYGWLGGTDLLPIIFSWFKNPVAVFLHIIQPQNWGFLFMVFLPFLFVPLLKLKYLWLSALTFLQFIMFSGSLNRVILETHYVLLFLPTIFIALIFALRRIKNRKSFLGSKFIYQNKNFAWLIVVFTVVYFAIFLSPVNDLLSSKYNNPAKDNINNFLQLIPTSANVATEGNLMPQLSGRPEIYSTGYAYHGKGQFAAFDFQLPKVDYILMDYSEFFTTLIELRTTDYLQPFRNQMPQNWRNVLADYQLIKAVDDVLLFEHKDKTIEDNLSLVEFEAKINEQLTDFLITRRMSELENKKTLQLTFQKTIAEQDYYHLIRFYRADDSYFDIPLDYGLWPISEWPDDQLISFFYYPQKELKTYQLFRWQGTKKLGKIRQVVPDLIIEPISDKFNL